MINFTVNYQSFLNFMQYYGVFLLSKDNLLRNTLLARISCSVSCNLLEGAKSLFRECNLLHTFLAKSSNMHSGITSWNSHRKPVRTFRHHHLEPCSFVRFTILSNGDVGDREDLL